MTEALLDHKHIPVSDGEDDLRPFMHEIRRFPRLTPEEERALAKRCAEGDEDAIRQMVNCNLRLVVSVAREYAGRGVPLLDLIQEGSIGLLAAARKFDYTLEYRFSTYATKWIRQGVTRYLINHGPMIRVPQHTAEQMRRVLQTKAALQQESGRTPTVEEIADCCNMAPDKVKKLLQVNPEPRSLDDLVGDDDDTLGSLIRDTQSPQPHEELIRDELKNTMEELLSMLTERQQTVLRLHFGMIDGVCHSLEDISIRYGVSKERIRQIEHRAMERLQELGAGLGLEDFLT